MDALAETDTARAVPVAAGRRERGVRAGLAFALWVVALACGAAPAGAAIEDRVRDALAVAGDATQRVARGAWERRGFVPRFVEGDSPFRATPLARDVVEAISAARDRGLDPAAYDAAALRRELEAARDEVGAARLEARLAFAWARFLADAGFGRIDPRTLGYDLPPQRRRDALAPALAAALDASSPVAALTAIEPTLPPYRPLLAVLADWRRRAALPPIPPLPAVRGKVSPGDAWAGVDALRARVRREGDLASTDTAEANRGAAVSGGSAAGVPRFEGELVEAVRRFQSRHGLEPDGVIGSRTLAALNVTPAQRVRQIELSLERMRWLGAVPAGRFVAVNIPEYRLWAVEDGRVATTMAVVVGRSVTATPVFVDAIEAVEFNPYWNVPTSIASKELYPRIERDAGWLASQHMDLIGAPGGDLRRALATGAARLRQRPGADNALGRVRFVMPNAHDVYLHDTPARTLFAASRRDFSHGCIRLERPLDLVAFALAARPEWTAPRVEAAIAGGRNQTVPIGTAPIPVLIFYSTVNVGEDGRARFLPDVYGLDAALDTALGRLR